MPRRKVPEALEDVYYEIEFRYYAQGPDEKNPESGLQVDVRNGNVEFTQWDLTPEPDDPGYREDWEERPVVKVSNALDLVELMDPSGVWRGSYVGDEETVDLDQVVAWWGKGETERAEKAIVAAALSYLGYYGGSEEMVEGVGD
jgi:hypothetical protein